MHILLETKQYHITNTSITMTSFLNEPFPYQHSTPSTSYQSIPIMTTQTRCTMIFSSIHPTNSTPLQLDYIPSKTLSTHLNPITLYNSNHFFTQHTLSLHRFLIAAFPSTQHLLLDPYLHTPTPFPLSITTLPLIPFLIFYIYLHIIPPLLVIIMALPSV